MKFLLALVLSLSFTATIAGQTPSPVKDLPEGFQYRTVDFDDGATLIQIKFPEKYQTLNGSVYNFRKGTEKALVLYFGCRKFKLCKPQLRVANDLRVLVGLDTYMIHGMPDSDTNPRVIGINLMKVPTQPSVTY